MNKKIEGIDFDKYGLISTINISDSSHSYNKKKVIKNVIFLHEDKYNNCYLALKRNHKSLVISKQQSLIENDEKLIFKTSKKKDEIELINCIDKCYECTNKKKYYEKINNIFFKLWKSIQKIDKEENINNRNKYSYLYYLKENDIIRLGKIAIILRKFHTINNNNNNINNNNNNNECKKTKRQFTMVLESYPGLICSICNENYTEENNPIIKLCECEKYRHFKCMKEEIRDKTIEIEKNGCIRYYIKTNCLFCKKFIPLSFYVKEGNELNFYELLDIPLNNSEEYLLFETLDFQDSSKYEYFKYIFLVKFRGIEKNKNIETILIGSDRNKNTKYKRYDKLMKIEHITVSSEHAIIEYDIEEKTLILKNISDSQNLF